MLADRVRSQFSPETISRGEELLIDMAMVEDTEIDPGFVSLRFADHGSVLTKVLLCDDNPYGGHLHAYCSCKQATEDNLCRHIWATVEAADRIRWGGRLRRGTVPLQIVLDPYHGGVLESARADYFAKHRASDDVFERIESEARKRLAEYEERGLIKPASRYARPKTPTTPDWQRTLEEAQKDYQAKNPTVNLSQNEDSAPKVSQVLYVLNAAEIARHGQLRLQVHERKLRANGSWTKAKPLRLNLYNLGQLTNPADVALVKLLLKADASEEAEYDSNDYYGRFGRPYTSSPSGKDKLTIPREFYEALLPQLAATGRLHLATAGSDEITSRPYCYRVDDTWTLVLTLTLNPDDSTEWLLRGEFRAGLQKLTLDAPTWVLNPGLIGLDHEILALNAMSNAAWYWAGQLRKSQYLKIPASDLDQFFEAFAKLPEAPTLEVTASDSWRTLRGQPTPRLSILSAKSSPIAGQLVAQISFNYDGRLVGRREPRSAWVDPEAKILKQRCLDSERRIIDKLLVLPTISELPSAPSSRVDISLAAQHLPPIVAALAQDGWHVEAEGRRIYHAAEFQTSVNSGINWFDLKASAKFGGESVPLPQLLEALKRGEQFVTLGDGSMGLLPSEWLAKFAAFGQLAQETDSGLRFKSPQGVILDALIDDLPEVDLDAKFATLRRRLKQASAIKAVAAPSAFKGSLRDYQAEGLGWMEFLRESTFGGCLADDMGLGKTVQVLALLQKHQSSTPKPSLIVVPRSLVHNWMREAARFCPTLRVLDFASGDRHRNLATICDYDIVVTTYGLLRLDIDKLRKIGFHYAIVDEAQAIKNKDSLSSKAARLLKADHRLALSGTPVENHLGELGAIFEFLNPGMLSASLLRTITKMTGDEGKAAAAALGKALRPFILRRTKDQVLQDLPAKLEQTLYCDLEPSQRQLYDELLTHYRRNLSDSVKKQGLNRTKIQVVEALLRLRQAACHPGLIDKAQDAAASAKLELLMERLRDVVDSGHKALVFSQFTSMLALVRSKLDQEGISYEYLDGKTRHRESRVERFQSDPTAGIFLISLKAGGVGLNLTAADYCFILDPWWNPAAEAQAIDRAHRLGQTKPVFAYRLIARDTIEDKILALQEKKRDLAQAIVNADDSMLGALSLEDLQMLLS